MSYRKVPMYVAVCDQCGHEFEDEDAVAFSDRDYLDSLIEEHGWTATRGRHLCNECVDGVIQDPDGIDPSVLTDNEHRTTGHNDLPLPFDSGGDA